MDNTFTAEPVAADSVNKNQTTTVPDLALKPAEKLPPAPKDNSPLGRIAERIAANLAIQAKPEEDEVKPEVDASEEKIEKIIGETKAPEVVAEAKPTISDKQREAINYFKEEEPTVTKEEIEAAPVSKQYEEAKVKLTEYESLLKNPLVEAMVEFTKSGKSDPLEFMREIGVVDAAKLSVEEMFKMKAQKLGFEGDELTEAVEEDMLKFDSMTKTEKREYESKLRDTYKAQTSDKLKSYTEKLLQERQRTAELDERVSQKAEQDLNTMMSDLLKKETYKGLPLTQEMIDQVKKLVPTYAPVIARFDESGNLTKYDIEDGADTIMWKLYGKQMLRNAFLSGRLDASEEFHAERTRVNPNNTPSASPAVAGESKQEAVKNARQESMKDLKGKNPFAFNHTKK